MKLKNRTWWSCSIGEKGSSLLSAVALAGILGTTAIMFSGKMSGIAKLGEMSKGSLARDLVAFQLRKTAYVRESYRNALRAQDVMTQNPDLYHCFSGSDTTPQCATYDSLGNPIVHPIRLYSATSSAPISDGGPGDPNPVYWDIQGAVCTGAGAANCPFEASTTFTAVCKDGSALCTQAYQFALTYTVQINPRVYTSVVKDYGALAEVTAQSPLYSVYQYYGWDWYPIMPLPYGVAPTGTSAGASYSHSGSASSCGAGLTLVNGFCVNPMACGPGQVLVNGRCTNAIL